MLPQAQHPSLLEHFAKFEELAKGKRVAVFLDYDGEPPPTTQNSSSHVHRGTKSRAWEVAHLCGDAWLCVGEGTQLFIVNIDRACESSYSCGVEHGPHWCIHLVFSAVAASPGKPCGDTRHRGLCAEKNSAFTHVGCCRDAHSHSEEPREGVHV